MRGLSDARVRALGDELYEALCTRQVLEPLTAREPLVTIDDAYHVSLRMVQRRLDAGERLIGKKIGVSSKAVQQMLGVHQPDFGFLTDRMLYTDGADMPVSTRLIQPRAEGEIAFRLRAPLAGPDVTPADVLAATESVIPCFEVVDSRIRDWKIKIEDTVADNASCGLLLLGAVEVDPREVDLTGCKMTVFKNDRELSTGYGSAALGSPLLAVAWLANTLGRFGITLDAGDLILSGSLVPLEPVTAGDTMRLTIDGFGPTPATASVNFT